MCPSISATAKRMRADHAADSVKITNVSPRSITPDKCATVCAGSLSSNHFRHCFCSAACSETRASAAPPPPLNRALTESLLRSLLTCPRPVDASRRLYRLVLLGIFPALIGQTRRKAGTQSHRSTARKRHDSGVASTAQVFSCVGCSTYNRAVYARSWATCPDWPVCRFF